MTRLGLLAVATLVALSCGGDGPSTNKPHTTPKPNPSFGTRRTPGNAVPKPRVLSGPRSLGSPHAGFIDQVVLSADGDAAMSRDNQGGVRFWATLDGSSQPLPAPISGAVSMSLARRKADRWTAALIDSAGAAHFYRVGTDGSWAELSATKPSRKVAQVDVLRGGKHALLLREDRVIELVDVDTAAARSSASRRRFRPTQLRMADSGKSGVAIEVLPSGKTTELSLFELSVDSSAGTLSLGKKLYSADEAVAVTSNHASLSSNGKTFAYLVFVATSSSWTVRVVDLGDGTARTVDLPLPNHLNPTLGFIDSKRLLVNTQPNGKTWEIDTSDEDSVTPRAAPATHLSGLPAHAFGKNHHLVGLGTWMYVRNFETKRVRYLGFEAFDPAWAAVSATGKYVAWATNRGLVYIESVSDPTRATRIESDQMAPIWRMSFVGDDRLITADSVGGIRMVDWKKLEIVAEVDSGGPIQQLEVSPNKKLLRVTRQIGQTWVFDIVGDELRGPYVIDDDSNRAGFLAGAGDAVLWTIDPANKYRTYTAAELRSGIDRKNMLSRGTKMQTRLPMAIGAEGEFYVLEPKGTRSELAIYEPGDPKNARMRVKIPSASVFAVSPSPDGKKIAVMRDTGILSMFDAKAGKQLWSFSYLQNTSILSWSADSKSVVSASFSGAALLDAKTGESRRTTCAPWFSVRDTAPPNAFSSQNAQLCSR